MSLPIKRFVGAQHYKKFTEGKHLTRKQAMEAKCFECCGGYLDGAIDCRIIKCPMYFYHPYKNQNVSSGDLSNESVAKSDA